MELATRTAICSMLPIWELVWLNALDAARLSASMTIRRRSWAIVFCLVVLLGFVAVLLGLEDAQDVELVGRDLVEAGLEALLNGELGGQCAVEEEPGGRRHTFLESAHRTVVSVLGWVVVADARSGTEFLLPEQGEDEEANGGMSRPLPGV